MAKGQELSKITRNGLGAAVAQQNRDKPTGREQDELKLGYIGTTIKHLHSGQWDTEII